MEYFAQSVVEVIVGKLANYLIQEAFFPDEVRNQVQLLMLEFELMVAFLKDVDSQQEQEGNRRGKKWMQGNRREKKWMQLIRDTAYEAEDAIDTYISKTATSERRDFLSYIKRYACIPAKLKALHDVGSEIQRINSKIRRISESKWTYGIISLNDLLSSKFSPDFQKADPILQEQRLTSPDFEEADSVGFQMDSEELVKKLTDKKEPRAPRRCVVSVVGMGGLGKTTLTKKVYDDPRVIEHFNSRTWISISQEYVVTDLLQKILNCFVSKNKLEEVKKMDVIQLRHEIYEHLKDRRYLIVLDDIWSKEAWDDLKDAFPEMNNGSRVVLTTRNKDVALYADEQSQPHELRFLNNEESWELFCKKTFPGQDGVCPRDLEDVGRKIVEKCGGLPLAVVVIGGLLRTKTKDAAEWEKVHESISWHLVKGEFNISGMVSLNYKDLPCYLKPCFLYLGNFPEDYEFHAKKLIRMWSAEGFLEERGEETLEEVGEDYLKELIQRSIVQVTERSSSRGIKKCRIHDLVRDLSILEAKEGMFLQVHSGINANAPPASRARRLAIHHNNSSKNISLSCSPPHLRSLLMYTQDNMCLQREDEKILYGRFKLLRVLCLDRVIIKKLPREIGELIHLRYLGCTETELKSLPSSIGNLSNLQTLFVESPNNIKVPSTIGKMRQLRHLQLGSAASFSVGVIEGHPRLEQKSNLQTLSRVKAGKWMESCLENLTNLRKLGIVLVTTADAEVFQDSIVKLGCLHSLSVSVNNFEGLLVPRNSHLVKLRRSEQFERQEWSLPPFSNLLKLSKLYLGGKLEKLPESAQFPVNLTKLTLEYSGLKQDPLATLEKLEKLRILKLLDGSYEGKEMVCSSQGFPQLESLILRGLDELEEWRVEEGAMPSLLHLWIGGSKLKKLPEGLQHVTTLKKLELWRMPSEFEKRLKEDRGDGEGEGEDWHKIRHIPSIEIRDSLPGEGGTW